jgi:bifunctional DNase/RNase
LPIALIFVKQVIIHKLVDGVFLQQHYLRTRCTEEIIDARSSDAIALALRFDAPIFTYKKYLDIAGIYLDPKNLSSTNEDGLSTDGALTEPETFGMEEEVVTEPQNAYKKFSLSELHEQLETADKTKITKAARIRDEFLKEKAKISSDSQL